jgi:hypothetical protein
MSLKQAAVDTAARKDSRPFFLPNNVGLQDLTPFLLAGKAMKLALTACMRKLLTILNAMLKSGTPWRVAASPPA